MAQHQVDQFKTGIWTVKNLLLSLDQLSIPDYQRPYKWTARNAIQLLDDIIEAMNSNKEKYRVGTLILHQQKGDRYDIVDGQQRTITFSLLLTALGEKNISFLRQPVYNNEHNCRNIPNNFQALCRRLGKKAEDENTKKKLIKLLPITL